MLTSIRPPPFICFHLNCSNCGMTNSRSVASLPCLPRVAARWPGQELGGRIFAILCSHTDGFLLSGNCRTSVDYLQLRRYWSTPEFDDNALRSARYSKRQRWARDVKARDWDETLVLDIHIGSVASPEFCSGGTGAWRTGSEVRGDKVIQKWKPSGVRSAKTNMAEVFLQQPATVTV